MTVATADLDDTQSLPAIADLSLPAERTRTQRRSMVRTSRLVAIASSVEHLGTYIGAGLLAVGFVFIAVAWHDMARQTLVPYQLPYLASGVAPGVALILCGLTLIAITVRARDTAARRKQLMALAVNMQSLETALVEQRVQLDTAIAALKAAPIPRRAR